MSPDQWELVKYFKPSEFDSPDAPGSGFNMDWEFMRELDGLREDCGFPFVIHSGYRTKAHNAELPEAVEDSAHESGFAADVGAPTSGMRFSLVQKALLRGFTRIGVASTFVHLDRDPKKPQRVLWLYSKR